MQLSCNRSMIVAMRGLVGGAVLALVCLPTSVNAQRGGWADPPGGWDYLYEANAGQGAFDGTGAVVLDGTWACNNGSSSWDGTGNSTQGDCGADPDGPSPGGAEIVSVPGEGETGGNASVLQVWDPGDPRTFGCNDPSNRKLYFTHTIAGDPDIFSHVADVGGVAGFSVVVRFRVISDELWTYAEDHGFAAKGMIQMSGRNPAGQTQTVGYYWDEFYGDMFNFLTAGEDLGMYGDYDIFISLRIAAKRNVAGGLDIKVYRDGETDPLVERVNVAGGGASEGTLPNISFGLPSTGGMGAIELDYIGYRDGYWPAASLGDSDGDGLSDAEEADLGTDPKSPDTDLDGLLDGDDLGAGCDPLLADSDGDGMQDDFEVANGLQCKVNDAGLDPDNDQLNNLGEYGASTNPKVADSDGDGLQDGPEVNDRGTNPNAVDTDGDRLVDGADGVVALAGLAGGVDTDGDGFVDGETMHGTDPLLADTDGDGLGDGVEVLAGINALSADSDGDTLNDFDEARFGTDPQSGTGPDGPDGDPDGDGVSTAAEIAAGTNPAHAGAYGAMGGWKAPKADWDYVYLANPGEDQWGTDVDDGPGFDSLDGTWGRGAGSDAWDGTAPGEAGGVPGGAGIVQLPGEGEDGGDASVLSMEDVGDPRNDGFNDPSNRKIALAHPMSIDWLNALNVGVTMIGRIRVNPAPADLAEVFPGGYAYSDNPLSDGGKPRIGFGYVRKDSGGGVVQDDIVGVAFMDQTTVVMSAGTDDPTNPPFTSATVDDTTKFHSFWMTVKASTIGGYDVAVYMDGATEPAMAVVGDLIGTAADSYPPGGQLNYLHTGLSSTGRAGSVQIDYVGYALGAHAPVPAGGTGDEPVMITGVVRVGQAVQLTWEDAGAGTYKVLSAASLEGPFEELATGVAGTQYVDESPLATVKFYKVVTE